MLDTFVPGLLKCGVFVKLKDSARNCTLTFSVALKSRDKPRSRLVTPGIEVRLPRTRPAQNFGALLYLIGALRASGSVQGGSRCAYAERRSAVAAENPVELPTAEDGARDTRLSPARPGAERRHRREAYLEIVRPVVSAQPAVQCVHGRNSVAANIAQRFRERVGRLHLQAALETARNADLQRIVVVAGRRQYEKSRAGRSAEQLIQLLAGSPLAQVAPSSGSGSSRCYRASPHSPLARTYSRAARAGW